MSHPSRLGPRRAVRIRVFDGTHEVLGHRDLVCVVDLDSPALNATMTGLLIHYTELAQVLENEPMEHPRVELWCAISNVKLHDYLGGPLL
jgi:hypothetical protein